MIDVEEKLLSLPKAFKDFPFGGDVAVYKVKNKMFALLSVSDEPGRISLKCDPVDAEALRGMFPAVIPGYHLNKKHWNTVILDDSIPDEVLIDMIDTSFELVVKKLKKEDRDDVFRNR